MKNKKAEIGTVVMMALLVIVSFIGFSSQKFLSSKKTISTQAATNRLCCLKYGCGLYGASAEQRKVTAIGFEGVNAQGTAGYTSCLNTGYTGSFYCDSLSGAPTTNGTSTYVTSADCTTSSTPTQTPTPIPTVRPGDPTYTPSPTATKTPIPTRTPTLAPGTPSPTKSPTPTKTPTPTSTPIPSPTLPQVGGNNQVCVDRFKTAYTYCGNYFGSTFSCTKTDNVGGNILKYVSYNYVCGIGTLNKDSYCCVREDADTSPNLTNQTLPTPLQGSPDQICKAALNTELTYCQSWSGCFKQDAVNGKAVSYHETSARCDNLGNERKCCVRDDVCTNCHNVSFTYTTEAQTVTTDTGQQGQFINLPEEGTVFFGP